VDLDEPETPEMQKYDEQQIKDYQHALRLIQKAYKLNDTIPIINEHHDVLVEKIRKVIEFQPESTTTPNEYIEDIGFKVIISDDEKDEAP